MASGDGDGGGAGTHAGGEARGARPERLPLRIRLAAAYGTFYFPLGIQMPFLPLWLADRGLGPKEIAVAIAVPSLSRLLASPLIGFLSDHLGRPRATLSVLALGTVVALVLLHLSRDPLLILLMVGLTATLWHPGFALLDAYATRQVRAGKVDYGRARQWGSGSFIIANLLGGSVIAATGAGSVVLLMLAGQVAYLFVGLALPELPKAEGPRPAAGGGLAQQRGLVIGVLAAALVQASHAAYYAFASVHWEALGYSTTIIGTLWATGVTAEMVLFRFASRLTGRVSPYHLIALGGAAAALRFVLLALDPPLTLLYPLQMLHALTFGATYLGMVELVARAVSEHRAGSGQSLAAWMVNVATSGASLAAGPLWVAAGPLTFVGSAALGLAGGALALLAPAPQPQRSGEGG